MVPSTVQWGAAACFIMLIVMQLAGQLQLSGSQAPQFASHSAAGGPATTDVLADAAECPRFNWTSIAYLHVPKASGNTFWALLKMMLRARGQGPCRFGRDNPNGYRFRPVVEQYPWECATTPPEQHAWMPADAAAEFPSRCQLFKTHLSMGLLEAMGVDFGRHLSVVNLRRPVNRLVSNFFFTLKTDGLCDISAATSYDDKVRCRAPGGTADPFDPLLKLVQRSGSLGEALRRYAALPLVRNRITQQLGGNLGCQWRGIEEAPLGEAAMLAAAKARLARFCLLLLTERLAESVELLEAAHGGPLPREERKNPTGDYPAPPAELAAELEAAQHLDNELYAFGAALFDARLRRHRAEQQQGKQQHRQQHQRRRQQQQPAARLLV